MSLISKIASENNIKIIFATEVGSKIHGWNSHSSDIDIKYIFTRSISDYLSIDNLDDCIDIETVVNGKKVDIKGYDIRKFCSMLHKHSPEVLEMLTSGHTIINCPIITDIKNNELMTFYPNTSLHYFSNMSSNILDKELSGSHWRITRFLLLMKFIFQHRYVEKYNEYTSTNLTQLMDIFKNVFPIQLYEFIHNAIEKRLSGDQDIVCNEKIKNMVKDELARQKSLKWTNTFDKSVKRFDKYIRQAVELELTNNHYSEMNRG
jgi:predicted nucleotidyltransferase